MRSLDPARGVFAVWRLFLFALALMLAACGGPGDSGGVTGGTGTGTTPQPATIQLSISSHNVSPSQPATLTAKVLDGAGKPVANLLVTFATDSNFGVFNPASGTTLTDSNGVATATLQAGPTSGAASVTVTAVVPASTTTSASSLSASTSYLASASASAGTTLGLTPIEFGANPLSAYGTTSVKVTVQATTSGNTTTYQPPVTVNFSSRCSQTKNVNGVALASLTSSVTTVNGIAIAQYRDNGCNSTDPITATVANASTATSTSNLTVASPAIGSIQFVSVKPSTITLAGTGGAGLGQTSTVVFRVVDAGGNPIQANVNFVLSTTVGGITLTNATAISDPVTGLAQTIVNSGTIPTPVRVTASIQVGSSVLTSQSDILSISTGLPDQAHFSTAASTLNIEGLNHDGVTTTITARLADHFGNPVPDGTAVNFITAGGAIQPQCTTTGGACSVVLNSQNARPLNGRVTVLAYAVGESCFTDLNGNGLFDGLNELIDVNGFSCSMPEAFLDLKQTGSFIAGTDPFVDFNQNKVWDDVDGLYHGSLCSADAQAAGACSTQKSIHVRNQQPYIDPNTNKQAVDANGKPRYRPFIIVFGGSDAVIDVDGAPVGSGVAYAANSSPIQGIKLPLCGTKDVNVFIRDVNGNAMPAGTTINITTTKGSFTFGGGATVQADTTAVMVKATGPGNTIVELKDDGTTNANVCTASQNPSGALTITVTTPLNTKTSVSIPVSN